jgi:Xaa-Pro dipeptidase
MTKGKKDHRTTHVRPDDIDPKHRWDRPLQAPGRTQVDFEERVDFRRLHDYRLARVRAALAHSGLGALLSFDQHNIRYTTSTVIGEWARDKLTRYSLLTGNGEPYIWDFGSAARHHKLYSPWLREDHCRAGLLGMRGATGADLTLFRDAAREIKAILQEEGVADMPLGVDVVEPPMLFALQKAGIEVRDGQQVMLQAREVKNIDELTLLNMAAAMVDGVYQDIAEALKPGVQESQIVALATKRLYEMGSDCVEAINSISGERCSPHPHNFTDRLIRPGDQAFFDIIQSFMGYRTCYYRTFNVGRATPAQRTAYKKAREWMDRAIELLRPGMTSDKIALALPEAKEIGFASEMDAFGLNFCHGLGLGLHERPLISRLTSLREPIELKAGMVFAVETYCPATDGVSAARIEEEVILTPKGAKIITLYPAEELPIANPY